MLITRCQLADLTGLGRRIFPTPLRSTTTAVGPATPIVRQQWPVPGIVLGTLVLICLAIETNVAPAQNKSETESNADVLVLSQSNSDRTVRRRGVIQNWLGRTITINSRGQDREIDSGRLIELKTQWPPGHQQAQQLFQTGQTNQAIRKYQQALQSETRPWARRIIYARLMDAYLLVGNSAASAKAFRLVLADDPNSRFIVRMPLPWSNRLQPIPAASQWMDSDDTATQLLGAGWSVTTSDRQRAIEVLTELSGDLDPRIRDLATAQLWRARNRPNVRLVKHWQNIVAGMDSAHRAGPLFVLAENQLLTKQTNEAILSLMKIVTLHEDQPAMVAASLSKIAQTLAAQQSATNQQDNQPKLASAQSITAELKSRFPDSPWSK